MATRNFIQQGLAYGTTIASIVVTVDGKEIYSGPAPTTDQPLPPMPGTDIEDIVVEWSLPADFSGPLPITLQVTGSDFVLADSLGDRTNPANTAAFSQLVYSQTTNSVTVNDPFTDVTIDGVAQVRDSGLSGQWYWVIHPGQTFTGNLNITAGINYPDWTAETNYPAHSPVVYQNQCWANGQNASPAGTVPGSSPEIWFSLPVPSWNTENTYPVYSRVAQSRTVYMAIQNVPAGVDITNTQYWEYQFTGT